MEQNPNADHEEHSVDRDPSLVERLREAGHDDMAEKIEEHRLAEERRRRSRKKKRKQQKRSRRRNR